jgi:protein-tyrosine phosphatase
VSAPRPVPLAPFSVLLVCTGNICRSPAAELLLRAALGPSSGTRVSSAGLDARDGEPVAPPMAALLRGRGLDPDGLRARQLQPEVLRAADLVLTMTAEQRSGVVRRLPAAVRRVFTLREFAELAGLVGAPVAGGDRPAPAARLAAVVAAVPAARALRGRGEPADVEDPYGRDDAAYTAAFTAIETAVGGIAAVLGTRADGGVERAADPVADDDGGLLLRGDVPAVAMTQRSDGWSTRRWPLIARPATGGHGMVSGTW